jgi:DNA (cytosine-5)-methyltransferase 1
METVAFCEIEPYPRKVLAKHWPNIPIYEDVRNVTKERLDADGIFPDVITGGFPCQDISVAGKQAGIGEGTRSGLWSECARILGEFRPRYAIFENVTALLSGEQGKWFERVLWDISQVGYDAEWHCIRACSIRFPHSRDRVWILAYPTENRRVHANHKTARIIEGESLSYNFKSGYRWCREDGGHSLERVGWSVEPAVCGSNDGLSTKLDQARIAGLGNAVVPQIPELIGRAIMDAENG